MMKSNINWYQAKKDNGRHGRLLFRINNTDSDWNAVCDDGWGYHESVALCKELGYEGGTQVCSGNYAATGKEFGVTSVSCPDGAESLSAECSFQAYNQTNVRCYANEEVAVSCGGSWEFDISYFRAKSSRRGSKYVFFCAAEAAKHGQAIGSSSYGASFIKYRNADGQWDTLAKLKYKRSKNVWIGKASMKGIDSDGCFECVMTIQGDVAQKQYGCE